MKQTFNKLFKIEDRLSDLVGRDAHLKSLHHQQISVRALLHTLLNVQEYLKDWSLVLVHFLPTGELRRETNPTNQHIGS